MTKLVNPFSLARAASMVNFRLLFFGLFVPTALVFAYLVWGPVVAAGIVTVFMLLFTLDFGTQRSKWKANLLEFDRLPQQPEIIARLDSLLRKNAKTGQSCVIVMTECDHFEKMKEQFDSDTIDQVLREISARIVGCFRENDFAAFMEGSRFAVVLSNTRNLDVETIVQLAQRLQNVMSKPIAIDGENILATCSVGYSQSAALENPDAEEMIRTAKIALSEAQRHAPGTVRGYSAAMKNRVQQRQTLAGQVQKAVRNKEFCAFFQPQISTKTGEISGFEALARWKHPQRGVIPPVEFLPALSQVGSLGSLGSLMLDEGLRALQAWEAEGYLIPRIGINFSMDELDNPQLFSRVASALDKHQIAPDRLCVEVLETVIATQSQSNTVLQNLALLTEHGCRIDLDDFGTGFASLTSIRQFSIDRLKIDRSFVTDVDRDPEQQKMISAILTMAERLGLDTLAEGVENDAELAMLKGFGCRHVQGYGIARPMPLEDTFDWIRGYNDQPIATTQASTQPKSRA